MSDIKILLSDCRDAELKEWAKDKPWQEIYNTCPNGGWLLSLFAVSNPDELQLLTLAKGHCANTVRYLMKDERSIAAVDAAIAFGEGKIGLNELKNATNGANDARRTTKFGSALYYDAAEAATAAADVILHHEINGIIYTAVTYYAAQAAAGNAGQAFFVGDHECGRAEWDTAGALAEENNQLKTANVVRKYIPIDKWKICN